MKQYTLPDGTQSGVPGNQLQLVSKAWTDEMGRQNVREACYRSLNWL
ncbi:MAG: hypothetical protein HFG80_14985 [Eubacterium sp.]|nr:hypothetical protein [Eubacterium sp.]